MLAVRVECRECKSTLLLDIANVWGLPDKCHQCMTDRWLVGPGTHMAAKALRELACPDPKAGATTYLEIDADQPLA